MEIRRAIVLAVVWLCRIGGAIFCVAGVGCFVTARTERSMVPVLFGIVAIAFGAVVASVRATRGGGVEYGIFQLRRRGDGSD